jgi:hypothetical protein
MLAVYVAVVTVCTKTFCVKRRGISPIEFVPPGYVGRLRAFNLNYVMETIEALCVAC